MREETGYYHVNGIHFSSKILAILEAQRTNSEVEWYFFDEVFKSVNWTIEPQVNIDEMYRQRALQLREKYDYIIVRVSGGADSTNVVFSFLNNGIHIDEVIADTPWSGISNWEFNNVDTSVNNYASEFKYAQMPILHDISVRFPKIKITMRDPFKEILEFKTDEWMLDLHGLINPWTGVMGRYDNLSHLADIAESGKSIAVISGVDKPVLTQLPNGMICSMMADIPITAPKPPFKKPYPNVDRILFYWTHEMPELIVKMSHVAARAIHLNENKHLYQAMVDMPKNYRNRESTDNLSQDEILSLLINKSKKGYEYKNKNYYNAFSVYERGIVPFIYPKTYVPNIFQADKIDPSETFFSRNHEWFRMLHKDIRTTQLMESDFKQLYKSIQPQYLNPRRTGFKHFAKSFIIGHTDQFKQKTY